MKTRTTACTAVDSSIRDFVLAAHQVGKSAVDESEALEPRHHIREGKGRARETQ